MFQDAYFVQRYMDDPAGIKGLDGAFPTFFSHYVIHFCALPKAIVFDVEKTIFTLTY
jgi:hypothetical protein